ncbi:hypothetical protein [Candidatus Jettenia sp. AMX1]|uniref:hypothetical protein n=1 Tax=Candidatus Jettenia sp. AMX1 TaxID=2293637 RepID=UPI001A4F16D1|nr:hypothetical protein [Candidatus Jettenia sp. AMX1]MDL1938799.1 hypothetical protein [Candidatus Jettenia sp. AMX1]WKZ15605.1 MAG: hypothetical protein QY317_17070 [Candidatus Jettenia caeni]GIL20187.1 MAG: hypothetical protein BroJett041_13010 [Candidatus Jettenia caeni]GJQ44911.1 MAG: hypothetical protein JETCAE04_06650 [Candidatus Jettenia caeni]
MQMTKGQTYFVSILKKWIKELNIEKVLLIISVMTFCSIFFSLRGKLLQDIPVSKKNKAAEGILERVKGYMGLPDEIQIPKQKISDITLTEPQAIFMRDAIVQENEPVTLDRNPFFSEAVNAILGEKSTEAVIEKEEYLFIGIMNLKERSKRLSVVLKGARSGRYRTLLEGDEWDGIKVISIDTTIARIMNRKGIIQDYTTAPNKFTIR